MLSWLGRLMIAALVATGVSAGTAQATEVPAETPSIQTGLNPDGTGYMIANSQSNPVNEAWAWDACRPDLTGCTPFGTGRQLPSTAGAQSDTVFRATSSRGLVALSPVWHGNVSPISSPSVTGAIRANKLVSPVRGLWAGGWDGAVDSIWLSACRDPEGARCLTLTDPHYSRNCPDSAAVIDPAFTGYFLRVADVRLGAGPYGMLMYAIFSPYRRDVATATSTLSISVVGQIGHATGPKQDGCGPPPLNSASISTRGVVSVSCAISCRSSMTVERGSKKAVVRRRIHAKFLRRFVLPQGGVQKTLELPGRAESALGPGRALIVVKINGYPTARRSVVLE